MIRSQVTPSQLRLTYVLGLFILALLFTADLVKTRAKILNDVEVGLVNGTYVLAKMIGYEPVVSSETVLEFLGNIRLEPLTQITVMDTTFNVIAEFSEDNSPRHIRLSESELIALIADHNAHAPKVFTSADGNELVLKLNHLQDKPYFVLMASSRTFALETFYQRFAIYAFLLILAAVVGYLLLSIQLRLLRSETRFRTMIHDFADIPIQGFAPDGTVVYWNKASAEMYGYTEKDMIGRPIQDIISLDENRQNLNLILDTLVRTKESTEPIHWSLTNKDGALVEAVTYFTLLTDAAGKHEIFCIDVNVSELVQAQRRIQDLLDEKEMILKEVHHRIKNNMNTIAGMLWLQADTMKDKSAAQALLDAQGRIMNMMVLYNKLFRSVHFTTLSLKEFIEDMIMHIRTSQDPSERVEVVMNIVDAQIDSKKLQTIGMMVNELMSNVYKYAFPLGAEGKVSISMTFPQPDLLLLELRDTGKGLPESILNDSSDDGFGMMLIRMLIEQLDATSEIRNDHGACFSFRIPI
jgi:PAS domain S-box-containing protein